MKRWMIDVLILALGVLAWALGTGYLEFQKWEPLPEICTHSEAAPVLVRTFENYTGSQNIAFGHTAFYCQKKSKAKN